MPVTKFICEYHPGESEFPFDHFDKCQAVRGRPAFPPWLARAMAQKIVEDTRHAGIGLTVTRTMTCPREVYIGAKYDYALNPCKVAVRERGTQLHAVAAEKFDPEVWMTEASDPMRLVVEGEVFGVRLSMQIDALRRDLTEIVDLKFPNDYSLNYRRKLDGKAKPEHAVQLNVARILLGQQEWALAGGYDPESVLMTIWDHASGGYNQDSPEPMECPRLTEEEMLEICPGGGVWTIQQIVDVFGLMAEADEGKDDPEERDMLAAALPLVGKTMFNNKKCSQYCDVESICTDLCARFGEPNQSG